MTNQIAEGRDILGTMELEGVRHLVTSGHVKGKARSSLNLELPQGEGVPNRHRVMAWFPNEQCRASFHEFWNGAMQHAFIQGRQEALEEFMGPEAAADEEGRTDEEQAQP